jgi:lipopolysaccharide transport system permease protein
MSSPIATSTLAPGRSTTSRRANLRRLWLLTWSMALGDLRRQYAGSLLDVVWAVAKPLLELTTYTFVFAVLLKVRFHPEYSTSVSALFLFCGWMVYVTLSESLSRCQGVVRENVHLIRKVHVPAAILPAYVTFSELVVQLMRIAILVGASLIVGWGISGWALLLPLVLFFQFLFTYGLAMLLSTVAVFFKDVRQLLNPLLLIWMFISPVFYPESVFPRPFTPILVFNPLAHLIGIYRQILLNHTAPLPGQMIIFGAASITVFAVGWWVFRRQAPHFSDLLGG